MNLLNILIKKKMMLDLNKLSRNKISPNQFVLLYLLYFKDWEKAKKLFSYDDVISIRNSLIDTKFILACKENTKFTDTTISTKNVAKLLDIRSDAVNFLEFFNEYPMKIGNRMLRPRDSDTVEGKRLEKKYLTKVTSKVEHKLAVDATRAFVEKQRVAGQLQFLPALEVVINNSRWESWQVFITKFGTENSGDHVDAI
tara:strand:+ start:1367 stop:1960 length:594 start_codon:yes stop_codon:yes gene_type:complete